MSLPLRRIDGHKDDDNDGKQGGGAAAAGAGDDDEGLVLRFEQGVMRDEFR